jgi:hypothetical protein
VSEELENDHSTTTSTVNSGIDEMIGLGLKITVIVCILGFDEDVSGEFGLEDLLQILQHPHLLGIRTVNV